MVSDSTDSDASQGIETYFLALQKQLDASLGFTGVIPHPVGMGDEAEADWASMLEDHLPRRYQVLSKCFVVDHSGGASDEIDIALCDRQYSTMVFSANARLFVPAEAIYAIFEIKPRISRANVLYAADKVESVRRLHRTSAEIVDARGRIDEPKAPQHILGGLLTTGSDWVDGLGPAFNDAIQDQNHGGRLDLGCVLSHGGWQIRYEDSAANAEVTIGEHALVGFYLGLLRRLQEVGTAPAMDFDVWSEFLRHRGADE